MKLGATGQETPARLNRNFSMEHDGRKEGRKEGMEGMEKGTAHDLVLRKTGKNEEKTETVKEKGKTTNKC